MRVHVFHLLAFCIYIVALESIVAHNVEVEFDHLNSCKYFFTKLTCSTSSPFKLNSREDRENSFRSIVPLKDETSDFIQKRTI